MNKATYLLLLISIMLSVNVASAGEAKPKLATALAEVTGQNGRACIRTSDIRGYGADVETINIDAHRKYYVALTLYRCHNIDMAPRALFDSRFNEVCGGGRSYITTRNGRCPIGQIFEFENRKAAFAAVDEAKQYQKNPVAEKPSTSEKEQAPAK